MVLPDTIDLTKVETEPRDNVKKSLEHSQDTVNHKIVENQNGMLLRNA